MFSCRRCSSTIFMLTLYYLYTQVTQILDLSMLNSYRISLLALKKVLMFKITPRQISPPN